MSNAQLRRRLQASAVLVLVFGLCAALLLNVLAEDAPLDAAGYVIVNGVIYPAAGADSKIYRNQLERYGGKANVLLDDFNRWFAGLWQGRKLPQSVAWLSLIAALALYLVARMLPPDTPHAARDEAGEIRPDR